MEIEATVAFCGIGYIGHEVDAARPQFFQAVFPFTRDIGELPAFLVRNRFQEIDQDTGRGTPGVSEDFGFILVHADADFRRAYAPRQTEKADTEEDA